MSEEKTGMTGGEVLLKALEEEGVEVIFGYPGAVLLAIYDALLDSPIRHVLVRHEQGAVHAADGYARASGRVGVCLSTSGPGATNLVTGIANAYLDSIPLVVLTGQVPTSLLGTDAFQEADITGITMPITKHAYIVKDVKDIPRIVKEAFYLAGTGRPGPVLIDLPKNILTAENVKTAAPNMRLNGYQVIKEADDKKISEIFTILMESQKPVIYAGGGVITAEAGEALKQFSEKAGIPVVTTLMGIGSLPAGHSNLLGMVGMHGSVAANYAVDDCDLLIAVGVRFDDRVTSGLGHTFATKAKIVHIDIDPAEIGKVVQTDVPIIGDARVVLEQLINGLPEYNIPQFSDWWEKLNDWKSTYPNEFDRDRLTPQSVIEAVGKLAGEDAIVVTDVGQHQMWVAQSYPIMHTRKLATSGGLGTMGFGLPASVGAQIACPKELVVLFTGDGSFQMTIQELATISYNKLPVKIIILNNGVLGMVRQWQKMFCEKRYSGVQLDGNPDFVKVAEAYNIFGIRVTSLEQLDSAVEQVIKHSGPALLDVAISPEEDVFPLVPPGNALTEMIGRR